MLFTLLRTWKQLLVDEKFTHVNAMRLSFLGLTRWILLLVLNIVQNECLGISSSCDDKLVSTWEYAPRTASELADYRDLPDEFVLRAMMIVRILMDSELR